MYIHAVPTCILVALLGTTAVQGSPAPATTSKAPVVAKQLLKNPSFETAQFKNGSGAADWVIGTPQGPSSASLVVLKTDKSAEDGKSYLSLSVDPAVSNNSMVTQLIAYKDMKGKADYTLTGFYRVRSYSGGNSTSHFGLWYIKGYGRLAARTIVRGNSAWTPFTTKIPDPYETDYMLEFGVSGNAAAFELDLDGLGLKNSTQKGSAAKNHVAAVPPNNFFNPSFEVASNYTPFAAGWTQNSDSQYSLGNATAVAVADAKAGKRVMRLSATSVQRAIVSVPNVYLDYTKAYNLSCWTRVTSYTGTGKARLEYQLGADGNSTAVATSFVDKATDEWSLFSTSIDADLYTSPYPTGRTALEIAVGGDGEDGKSGTASIVAEFDKCSIKVMGESEAGQPWS